MRRQTPVEDIDRLVERMVDIYGNRIYDEKSFDDMWEEDNLDETNLSGSTKSKVRERTLRALGRMQKRGEKRVEEIQKTARAFSKSEEIGISGGRRVFVYKSTFTYKGKKRTVYRDRKGRFAKKL